MENSTLAPNEFLQWTTLKYACSNDPASFNVLLSGMPANIINGVVDGINLLFIACQTQSESVKHLLNCEKFTDQNINAVDIFGQTAVHIGCKRLPDAVKYLLASERLTIQTINAKDMNGYTALHTACDEKNEAIEYLLNCDKFTNQSVNEVTDREYTALHFVCRIKKSKYVDVLINSGKLTPQTINLKNREGKTALEYAYKYQSSETIQHLTSYIEELEGRTRQNNVSDYELTICQLQIENAELKQTNTQLELKLIELSSPPKDMF